tara:strand:- start:910 stop:1152 length:243 start_codon:yes stop_codon:yes gene_type:complete
MNISKIITSKIVTSNYFFPVIILMILSSIFIIYYVTQNKIFEGNDNNISVEDQNNVSDMTNKGTDNEDNVVNLITAIEES